MERKKKSWAELNDKERLSVCIKILTDAGLDVTKLVVDIETNAKEAKNMTIPELENLLKNQEQMGNKKHADYIRKYIQERKSKLN